MRLRMDANNMSDDGPSRNTDESSELKGHLKAKDEQIVTLTKQLEKAERQVSKYEAYNESLRAEISKLSAELHQYRTHSDSGQDVAIQVTELDIETESGNKPMPEWSHSVNSASIADSLKEAAESVLSDQRGDDQQSQYGELSTSSEYVYDASSGLYYHPATGYYWDSNSSLFYDYTTGTYYQFDETTGQYTVYSQIDTTADSSTVSSSAQYYFAEPVSQGRHAGTEVDSLTSQLSSLGLDPIQCRLNALDISDNYPSCIRAIVNESECLPVGTLFIITCTGGKIGRLKNKGHVMEIPDENVSKEHAQLKYDYEESCYRISDLGSQNGTWLNGQMLTKGSGEQTVSHGDKLHFCSTCVLCHIHKGSETCDDCEPGQVQAKLKATQTVFNDHVVLTKAERQRNRRNELKKIKKKYGLQNSQFEDPNRLMNQEQYTDKAQLRRQLVGSDVEGAKSESPASVYQPMSSTNKGHKLLAKMGWKEGQGLGKNNSGIAEPINVELRVNSSAGLGSAANVALSLDNVHHSGKAKLWSQVRQRFRDLSGQGNSTPTQDTTVVSSQRPHPSSVGGQSAAGSTSSVNNSVQKTKSRMHWQKGEVQYNDFPNASQKDGGDMGSSLSDKQSSGTANSDTRSDNS